MRGRAESMSVGHVVRHSPLHYNKKGTVFNRHLTFSRCWRRIQTGSSSRRSVTNAVFLETALRMTGKAWWHVPPPCSFITLITRMLCCIGVCGRNTRCLYSREPRKYCPSRSGHPTCPTRKFRIRSTRDKRPLRGKPNLQQTQAGLKVSGGDIYLRPFVKWWTGICRSTVQRLGRELCTILSSRQMV